MERFRAPSLDHNGNPLRRAEDIPSADGTPYRPPGSLSTMRDPPKKESQPPKKAPDDSKRRASPRGLPRLVPYYGNFA